MNQHVKNVFLTLFFLVLFFYGFVICKDFSFTYVSGTTAISGQVLDAATGSPLPARIVVLKVNGQVLNSYYKSFSGFFTGEDGTFILEGDPGIYTLKVYRGIDYLSQTHKIEIQRNKVLQLTIKLKSWVPLRKMGWINGDGHAHLYTNKKPNEEMAATVRQICRAQGVDFISANQGWAGFDENNWRQGYARFSDGAFLLHYGAEMPKYRTGHTWWLGLKSCRGYFSAAMDTTYEMKYYQSPENTEWNFSRLKFPNIPDVELVPRFKKAENTVAIMAHPCSWWWQKRGHIEKYTTNVVEYLAFGLLAGKIWDGMVVMGYDRDHYFYQNLWFHVLNEGYQMPALAELDGGYGPDNRFYYGSMRTFFYVGPEMSMENIADAVRKGRTFVTSGPIVFTSIDNQYQPGDVITANGKSHKLFIEAYASGENKDFLSYLLVFRNGKIHKLWDLRDKKPRHITKELDISEKESAWYSVKVYGKNAWDNPENLDIVDVCQKITAGCFKSHLKKENDICITSPFYFRPQGEQESVALISRINLKLINPKDNKPVQNATIHVLLAGEKIDTIELSNGTVRFSMPVNAMLKIRAKGLPEIRRGLYLDYEPHLQLIEKFASGRWLNQNGWKEILQPGQVPWEAFQYETTKEILSDVDWTIVVAPNERDQSWQEFEALF